jgi:hypothetical protein
MRVDKANRNDQQCADCNCEQGSAAGHLPAPRLAVEAGARSRLRFGKKSRCFPAIRNPLDKRLLPLLALLGDRSDHSQ